VLKTFSLKSFVYGLLTKFTFDCFFKLLQQSLTYCTYRLISKLLQSKNTQYHQQNIFFYSFAAMHTMKNRLLENLHLPIWLIKDLCWAIVYKPLGVFMIAPAIALAVFVALKSHKNRMYFLPNVSVVFWILANSLWMLAEFYSFNLKHWFISSFILGMISMLIWIVKELPQLWRESKDTA